MTRNLWNPREIGRSGTHHVKRLFGAWLVTALLAPAAATAVSLDLPAGAVSTGSDTRSGDRVLFPTGPRTGDGGDGLVAEGQIERLAWELPNTTVTPFEILSPLVAQLELMGFSVRYTCRDRDCGGFDFRLALDLLPAPAMYVDLGDFRYLTALKEGPEGDEVISLVASRSDAGGHLHLTRIRPGTASQPLETQSVVLPQQPDPQPATEVGLALSTTGRAVLDDLSFRPGSSELGDGPFDTLVALADWLAANPDKTVVLVGHSDNVGGLNDNIRLSERRAAAVAAALGSQYGVDRARIAARGVGYLAPLTSNDTEDGRRLNRRVEVVVGAP